MKSHSISPIRISPNGRYFVDPAGHPVFWLGDTQWELFRQYAPDTALKILRDRHVKGFNIILIMLTGVDTPRVDPSLPASFANLQGELPWIEEDPLRPNERYFNHVDTMIRLGEQTGQIFVVGVYHQWHAHIIPLEKARQWSCWVAKRYKDVPNLIWSMYPRASEAYIPVCREIAAGLQEGDGGAHMISVHPDPSVASSSFIHGEDWLDFNMIQTCVDYDQIQAAVSADYIRTPVKPVVMAEGGYEGLALNHLQTAREIRQQAYWTQLAGGHHVYGHNDAWRFPLNWADWLDSPGSRSLARFHEIFAALPGWWDLVPDPAILASGAGSGFALNATACSINGDWLLAYLSGPGQVSIRLDRLTAGRQAQATWINPASDERVMAGEFAAEGDRSFTSPDGWEDAVLRITSM
ncbi:MAG: DUF4038 domain-containing protein [Chloroflexi bacterium]|nr:MAG: DUF4038 domain-containing protein [Chloroflexota bacterium]